MSIITAVTTLNRTGSGRVEKEYAGTDSNFDFSVAGICYLLAIKLVLDEKC